MPTFTRLGYLIGGALSVAIFGYSVIGANYSGVILHHLADVVLGNNTSVVVSTNAPNWEEGTPLAQVVGVTAATTTGGTVASSTAFTFAVAALDGIGTTTLSATATVTTDASTSPNEQIQLTWGAVPGATGYAIYFATSSSPTATLNQYFLATTTNGNPNTAYTFSTSTGSISGTYTKLDTTAFSTLINPSGSSYLNGGSLSIAGALTQGLPVNSTSTSATSQTLSASDIVPGLISMTPNTGALTLTLPASSTLSTFLPRQGQKVTLMVYNATTTAAATITISAGTGETIEHATSSAIRSTQMGTLEFLRLPSSNLLVFYNTGF